MLLCGNALAQPQEVTADETIQLRFGQTRTFRFDKAIKDIKISGRGVAEVMPQSDHVFDFRAIGYGRALATAFGPDGQEVERINIDVIGQMVKVYGQKPPITGVGKAGQEYDSYMCSGAGCGRVNLDIVSGPTAAIISDTQQDKDGNSHTVTKEYR